MKYCRLSSLLPVLIVLCICSNLGGAGADLIIFSFNRPLQLEALLRSISENLTGIETTTIIYRTSSARFAAAYEYLVKEYDSIIWLKQSERPEHDFKSLVMQSLKNGLTPYVLFAVDDIMVKNNADISICTGFLEQTGAYGFYLRLGTHLNYCYALSSPLPLPRLTRINEKVSSWIFGYSSGDWAYPNTVDMTIYRKKDVIDILAPLNFTNPNTMEKAWAEQAGRVWHQKGLCFNNSIALNIPLNIVQNSEHNLHLGRWSVDELLTLFEKGKRIDIRPLQGVLNQSCHSDCDLEFIDQSRQ